MVVSDDTLVNNNNNTAEDGRPRPGTVVVLGEDFQQNVRPLIDFIDTLRDLGIEKDVPIPQIAVMGDQSSGKSSVLEALSGIPFPRGAGLVTRCATQIRMGKGPSWSASASVRKHNKQPNDAESVVRRADTPEALGGIIEELTKELCGDSTFSKDVIEISLKSPDAPDLTVIDLPGIVRTTTTGQDEGVVDDVNALLETYLQPTRTIILAVIPCNVDVATVDILERAAKVDPEGIRTVGVLTKPDLVDKGGESEVLEVLLNKRKKLTLGFCMVKNRSQDKLLQKQSLEEAKAAEAKYFETHEVFKQAPAALLGVSNLTSKLTDLLVGHIKRVLPDLLADISKALVTTSRELKKCGDPPPVNAGDQRIEAGRVIHEIVRLLSRSVASGALATGMSTQARVFSQQIQLTKPDFEGKNDMYHCQFSFKYEDEEHTCEFRMKADKLKPKEPESNMGKRLSIGCQVYSTTPKFDGSCTVICPDGSKQVGRVHKEIIDLSSSTRYQSEHQLEVEWDVEWDRISEIYNDGYFTISGTSETYHTKLVQQITTSRARQLPGFLNFDIFTRLVIEFVDEWKQATTEMLKSITKLVQAELDRIAAHVIPCKYPALQMTIKLAFDRAIRQKFDDSVNSAHKTFDREREPSTQNHYLMDTVNKLRGDRYSKYMDQVMRDDSTFTGVEAKRIFKMLLKSRGNASNEEQEADDMADSLAAYWKVATKRFIDNMQQICDQELVRGMPSLCTKELRKAVTAASDDRLSQLFAVPSDDRNRRQQMQAKLERLLGAKQKHAELALELGIGTTPLRNHNETVMMSMNHLLDAATATTTTTTDDHHSEFEIDSDSL